MQQRAQETRRKILQAAVTVFSVKGLNGATVDEIAVTAGVNKQRLYAYYGSKQKLFEASLLHVFQQVELFSAETVKQAGAHPEKLTEILLRGFIRVHAAHPAFWRLLSWANLEGGECVQVLDRARKAENEALREIFDRALQLGLLREIRFETYLFTLLAVSYFYYSNRLTLSHTLDVTLSSNEWRRCLYEDLNRVFSRQEPDSGKKRLRALEKSPSGD